MKISTKSLSRSPLQPVWTACYWRDRLTITVIKSRSLLLRVLENCSWLTVCRVKLKKVKLFLFVNHQCRCIINSLIVQVSWFSTLVHIVEKSLSKPSALISTFMFTLVFVYILMLIFKTIVLHPIFLSMKYHFLWKLCFVPFFSYFMSNPKNCSTLYIMVQPSWNFENQFDVGVVQTE